MSETKTYKGKFISTELSVEKFVKDNLYMLPSNCEWTLLEKFYHIVEELCEEEGGPIDFFIKEDEVYEVLELEDLDYDNFIQINEVTGEFVTSFYNGGTCLSEMLERGE